MISERMLLWRFVTELYDDAVLHIRQTPPVTHMSASISRVIENIVSKDIFDHLMTQWIEEGSIKKVSLHQESEDSQSIAFSIHDYPSEPAAENTAEQGAAANP
jgi:hypothetical protein